MATHDDVEKAAMRLVHESMGKTSFKYLTFKAKVPSTVGSVPELVQAAGQHCYNKGFRAAIAYMKGKRGIDMVLEDEIEDQVDVESDHDDYGEEDDHGEEENHGEEEDHGDEEDHGEESEGESEYEDHGEEDSESEEINKGEEMDKGNGDKKGKKKDEHGQNGRGTERGKGGRAKKKQKLAVGDVSETGVQTDEPLQPKPRKAKVPYYLRPEYGCPRSMVAKYELSHIQPMFRFTNPLFNSIGQDEQQSIYLTNGEAEALTALRKLRGVDWTPGIGTKFSKYYLEKNPKASARLERMNQAKITKGLRAEARFTQLLSSAAASTELVKMTSSPAGFTQLVNMISTGGAEVEREQPEGGDEGESVAETEQE
ncbi:hypothetical protein BKA65DRAFT_205062 [Rhexocercosporidium sp. MPI-PUGE-AT-0058]|nr:hypothetical protein BKA65DRAFT_205062 [Rhexocercosporidium sp. MPI-PUGE-AT-0058]